MITKRTKWTVIGFIAIALLGAWVLNQLLRPKPRDTFEYLVTKPVPPSVNSIQEGSFQTMDSVLTVLRFHIAIPDLRSILDSQAYKPIDQEDMGGRNREDYLQYWEQRITSVAKLEIHFAKDTQGYTLKEGHGQKYIFWSTNAPEAVFIADAH